MATPQPPPPPAPPGPPAAPPVAVVHQKPPRKRRGCCCCCLAILLGPILLALGFAVFAYVYMGRDHPVLREWRQIPDYHSAADVPEVGR